MDILAERASQDPENRAAVKKLYLRDGASTVKGVDDKKKEGEHLPDVLGLRRALRQRSSPTACWP
jgi:transcriptional accessory protein Tex/SPT6